MAKVVWQLGRYEPLPPTKELLARAVFNTRAHQTQHVRICLSLLYLTAEDPGSGLVYLETTISMLIFGLAGFVSCTVGLTGFAFFGAKALDSKLSSKVTDLDVGIEISSISSSSPDEMDVSVPEQCDKIWPILMLLDIFPLLQMAKYWIDYLAILSHWYLSSVTRFGNFNAFGHIFIVLHK